MSTLLNWIQAYYKFDETTGTLAETSVWSSDITMSHSWILWGAWKINNGADFSGGNNRIGTSSAILTWTTDFAIGMWAIFPDNTLQFFLDNNSGSALNRMFFSRQSNTSTTAWRRIRFFYRDTGTRESVYSTEDTNDNEWYLLGFQKEWNVFSLWINWVQNNSQVSSKSNVLQTWTWKWGNHFIVSSTSTGLKGNLDEAWVWNRWLTSAEWLELYNSWAWLSYPFTSESSAWFLMRNF